MPAIGNQPGQSAAGEQAGRRHKKRQPTPSNPAPRGVTGAFGGASSQRPFAQQQEQAAAKTQRAQQRLPRPIVATPPIIENPTRAQTQAAARQITSSITRAVGSQGSAAERQQRRDAIVDRVVSDPRLARTRASWEHWATEQAKLIVPNRPIETAGPGPAPSHVRLGVGPVNLATINATAAGHTLGAAVAKAAPGLQSGSPAGQLVRNAVSDVGTIATAPFVGGYELTAAGVEGLKRRPYLALGGPFGFAAAAATSHRGQQLAKGLAVGTVQNAEHEVMHPGQAFQQHPLLTALDFAGAASVAGRTAGAVARGLGSTVEAEGVRGALARAGSTVRPPLALSDDPAAPLHYREYSKDLGRKAGQVAADQLRDPLLDEHGNPVMTTDRGRQVPVLKAETGPTVRHPMGERNALLKGAADTDASRTNLTERMVRDQASHEMRVQGIKGRRSKQLVAMVVEGTITSAKHFVDDLKAERGRIADKLEAHANGEDVYRHSGEVDAAKARVKLIDETLANPHVLGQAEKIVSVGEDIGRALNGHERKAVALGLLHPSRSRRARLIVPAVAHLGARHFGEDELKAMERSGVEVRDPASVARHRAAHDAVKDAKDRERVVQNELNALQHQRSRTVGAQAVQRGQEAQQGPLAAFYVDERRFATHEAAEAYVKAHGGQVRKASLTLAEAKRTGEMARLERAIAGRKRELRDLRRERAKAERTARRTPKPPLQAALRHGDGRFLSNTEIEAFLRSRGRDPETVAYLPHRLDTRGGRAFHAQFRPGSRGTMDSGETRTGSAYAKGVTESSVQLIREQGVRQAVQVNRAQAIDRMIGDMGMRRPDGAYWTPKEALEIAKRLREDGREELVPVTAFPAKLDPEMRRIIREDLQGPGGMDSLGQRLLNDRIVREGIAGDQGRRTVVLVPKAYVDRLNKHLAPAGEITKLLQMVNRPFRFAVLGTSLKWLTGNFVEPYIVRLTVNGSGLNVFGLGMDIAAATKVLRHMERSGDPRMRRAAQELRAQQLGGLGIGGRGLSVHREATDTELGQLVSKLPVVSQGFDLLRAVGHALMAPGNLFFRINRAIENVAQRAALGRDVRRDLQQFTGSWVRTLKLHHESLDEVAKGLVNTPTQRRFMRSQHEILGKYEGYPPWLRTMIQTAFPFIPWALNSARFTLWTMPAHHTALTALLTRVNDVVAKDWDQTHADVPPGSLKFAIPTKAGGWIDLARLTPYGLTTGVVGSKGLDWQDITGQALPAISGAAEALFAGQDPFGRDLQLDPREHAQTTPDFGQRVGIALNDLAEAFTPYLAQGRRLQEHGETSYAGSTIFHPRSKPGTSYGRSAARRTFDPLSPTYLGGASHEVEAPNPPPAPMSRRDQLLAKRAELLAGRAAQDSRLQALLEKRAQLLAGR